MVNLTVSINNLIVDVIIKMATYFVDFQYFIVNDDLVIKELCIMDADIMLYPLHLVFNPIVPWSSLSLGMQELNQFQINVYHKIKWDEGNSYFCPSYILKRFDCDNALCYILDSPNGIKKKTLLQHFPNLRLIEYNKSIDTLLPVPSNILCPFREHGPYCAYKHCLSMCVDYCKSS
jgi:hypothetical protein